MRYDNLPMIKVTLVITHKAKPLEILNDILGVSATRVRRLEDFPQSSIDSGYAANTWCFEIEEEECKALAVPLERLLCVFADKLDVLSNLNRNEGTTISIVAIVHMLSGEQPELFIDAPQVAIMAQMNAAFSIDLYDYTDEGHCQMS